MIKIISILTILIISVSSFASNINDNFQNQVAFIKSAMVKNPSSVTCQKLTEISNQVERKISEKSCPTSSDIDFSLCQQQSDSLSITETQKLKTLLSEVKTIRSENCMDISESDKVITASISGR